MRHVVETCSLLNDLRVTKLRHYKCAKCGSRFFDDTAMDQILSAGYGAGTTPVSCVAESRAKYRSH